MPKAGRPLVSPELTAFANRTLGSHGLREFGIYALEGPEHWAAERDEDGTIRVPTQDGTVIPMRIGHDEREAPVVLGADGEERRDLMVSLADEDNVLVMAWARVPEASPVAGVGVDLADTSDFRDTDRNRSFFSYIFSDEEGELSEELVPGDAQAGRTMVFSAKESAFKSTSQPLRRWYDAHDEELFFEFRDFRMTRDERGLHEVGIARVGDAASGLRKIGVTRIAVGGTRLPGHNMVLTCSVALRRDDA